MRRKNNNQKGFTLIECLIAMVITLVGMLAVAGLIVDSIRLQVVSRDAIEADAMAKAKIEELRNYRNNSPQRIRGGSLTTNITGYNDEPDTKFQRRWLIETHPIDAGVPMGTQRVTVTIIANSPDTDVRLPSVQVQVLMPAS